MSHRNRQHIETLVGRGWISLDGVRLSDATYHIDIWQQFVNTAHGETFPAARRFSGQVADHTLERFDLFNRVVRLHLENGGHLDCMLEGNRVKAAGVLMRTSH